MWMPDCPAVKEFSTSFSPNEHSPFRSHWTGLRDALAEETNCGDFAGRVRFLSLSMEVTIPGKLPARKIGKIGWLLDESHPQLAGLIVGEDDVEYWDYQDCRSSLYGWDTD
jgi:hypothetical protein